MANTHGLALLSSRILASSLGRYGRPFKLTFAPTMSCPYSCSFCHGDSAPQFEDASLERITEFLTRNNHFSWIDLTGGEIFSRPDLAEILEIIRRTMPGLAVLHFPTSGGADIEQVRAIVGEHRARSSSRLVATVSVNGPPGLDGELRGQPDAFGRSMETFKTLSGITGAQVFFGMTLVPQNVTLLEQTFSALTAAIPGLRRSDLHVNFFNRSSHFFGNTGCEGLSAEQSLKAVSELLALRRGQGLRSPLDIIERTFLRLMPRHLETGCSPVRCISLLGNVYVAPDLTVYPCTIWDHPLGRLDDFGFDLARLLKSDEARRARDMIANDRCPGCWTPCEAFPSLLDPRWPLGLRRKSLRNKG